MALALQEKEEMMFFGHDTSFWMATFGAAVVRILTAEYNGPALLKLLRAVTIVFTAVFAAMVFTDPVCNYLGLNLEIYKVPMAAVLALTGEGIMRAVIRATGDFKFILEAIKAWRGK
jgi:hypothetical protein